MDKEGDQLTDYLLLLATYTSFLKINKRSSSVLFDDWKVLTTKDRLHSAFFFEGELVSTDFQVLDKLLRFCVLPFTLNDDLTPRILQENILIMRQFLFETIKTAISSPNIYFSLLCKIISEVLVEYLPPTITIDLCRHHLLMIEDFNSIIRHEFLSFLAFSLQLKKNLETKVSNIHRNTFFRTISSDFLYLSRFRVFEKALGSLGLELQLGPKFFLVISEQVIEAIYKVLVSQTKLKEVLEIFLLLLSTEQNAVIKGLVQLSLERNNFLLLSMLFDLRLSDTFHFEKEELEDEIRERIRKENVILNNVKFTREETVQRLEGLISMQEIFERKEDIYLSKALNLLQTTGIFITRSLFVRINCIISEVVLKIYPDASFVSTHFLFCKSRRDLSPLPIKFTCFEECIDSLKMLMMLTERSIEVLNELLLHSLLHSGATELILDYILANQANKAIALDYFIKHNEERLLSEEILKKLRDYFLDAGDLASFLKVEGILTRRNFKGISYAAIVERNDTKNVFKVYNSEHKTDFVVLTNFLRNSSILKDLAQEDSSNEKFLLDIIDAKINAKLASRYPLALYHLLRRVDLTEVNSTDTKFLRERLIENKNETKLTDILKRVTSDQIIDKRRLMEESEYQNEVLSIELKAFVTLLMEGKPVSIFANNLIDLTTSIGYAGDYLSIEFLRQLFVKSDLKLNFYERFVLDNPLLTHDINNGMKYEKMHDSLINDITSLVQYAALCKLETHFESSQGNIELYRVLKRLLHFTSGIGVIKVVLLTKSSLDETTLTYECKNGKIMEFFFDLRVVETKDIVKLVNILKKLFQVLFKESFLEDSMPLYISIFIHYFLLSWCQANLSEIGFMFELTRKKFKNVLNDQLLPIILDLYQLIFHIEDISKRHDMRIAFVGSVEDEFDENISSPIVKSNLIVNQLESYGVLVPLQLHITNFTSFIEHLNASINISIDIKYCLLEAFLEKYIPKDLELIRKLFGINILQEAEKESNLKSKFVILQVLFFVEEFDSELLASDRLAATNLLFSSLESSESSSLGELHLEAWIIFRFCRLLCDIGFQPEDRFEALLKQVIVKYFELAITGDLNDKNFSFLTNTNPVIQSSVVFNYFVFCSKIVSTFEFESVFSEEHSIVIKKIELPSNRLKHVSHEDELLQMLPFTIEGMLSENRPDIKIDADTSLSTDFTLFWLLKNDPTLFLAAFAALNGASSMISTGFYSLLHENIIDLYSTPRLQDILISLMCTVQPKLLPIIWQIILRIIDRKQNLEILEDRVYAYLLTQAPIHMICDILGEPVSGLEKALKAQICFKDKLSFLKSYILTSLCFANKVDEAFKLYRSIRTNETISNLISMFRKVDEDIKNEITEVIKFFEKETLKNLQISDATLFRFVSRAYENIQANSNKTRSSEPKDVVTDAYDNEDTLSREELRTETRISGGASISDNDGWTDDSFEESDIAEHLDTLDKVSFPGSKQLEDDGWSEKSVLSFSSTEGQKGHIRTGSFHEEEQVGNVDSVIDMTSEKGDDEGWSNKSVLSLSSEKSTLGSLEKSDNAMEPAPTLLVDKNQIQVQNVSDKQVYRDADEVLVDPDQESENCEHDLELEYTRGSTAGTSILKDTEKSFSEAEDGWESEGESDIFASISSHEEEVAKQDHPSSVTNHEVQRKPNQSTLKPNVTAKNMATLSDEGLDEINNIECNIDPPDQSINKSKSDSILLKDSKGIVTRESEERITENFLALNEKISPSFSNGLTEDNGWESGSQSEIPLVKSINSIQNISEEGSQVLIDSDGWNTDNDTIASLQSSHDSSEKDQVQDNGWDSGADTNFSVSSPRKTYSISPTDHEDSNIRVEDEGSVSQLSNGNIEPSSNDMEVVIKHRGATMSPTSIIPILESKLNIEKPEQKDYSVTPQVFVVAEEKQDSREPLSLEEVDQYETPSPSVVSESHSIYSQSDEQELFEESHTRLIQYNFLSSVQK